MRRILTSAAVIATAASICVAEAPPRFAKQPTASKSGENVKIQFAADRQTDVAVSIENSAGQTVRHLAAGMLGGNAPEPLQSGSLDQTLQWDGRDDAGRPADGGPFTVRVRLGMRPRFDAFLLDNPDQLGMVVGIAADGKGGLVVLHYNSMRQAHCEGVGIKLLDRQGRYARTIMPYPADLPPERLGDARPFQTDAGELVPRLTQVFTRNFYPDPTYACRYSALVVDGRGRILLAANGPRLAAVDTGGGLPFPQFFGPMLFDGIKGLNATDRYSHSLDTPRIAVSSDGRWVYYSGLTRGGKQATPVPCVYRLDIEKRGPAAPFVGDPDKPGAADGLLTAPAGVAAAKGLLYVADRAAGRIVAYTEQDGALAGQIKADQPVELAADPDTGAVYALCLTEPKKPAAVVKFSPLPEGKEICRVALPPLTLIDRPISGLALDSSAKPPVLWTVQNSGNGNWLQQHFLRFTDEGSSFSKPADPRSTAPSAEHANDLTVDRRRGELYVRTEGPVWIRLDERTGKILNPRLTLQGGGSFQTGSQIVVGDDGNLYSWWWLDRIGRFDHDGKPLNWPDQSVNQLKIYPPMCFMNRGLCVTSGEELYGIPRNIVDLPPGQTTGPQGWWTCLNEIGPDARSRRTLIWECSQGAVLKRDRRGNIYLADMVKPVGRSYPEFFDGKLAPPGNPSSGPRDRDAWATSWFYGSIMKFSPQGGAIWYGPEFKPGAKDGGPRFSRVGEPPADLLAKPKLKMSAHVGYVTRGNVEVQGAQWIRFGYSPLTLCAGGSDTCMCEGSKFDVDEFGRVFFPNLNQFRVEVLDTNGNPITTFGGYGNLDSSGRAGPDSPGRGPQIPLAWPIAVAVSDTHAYVGDTLNRRVAKVKLSYAAEESCPAE